MPTVMVDLELSQRNSGKLNEPALLTPLFHTSKCGQCTMGGGGGGGRDVQLEKGGSCAWNV